MNEKIDKEYICSDTFFLIAGPCVIEDEGTLRVIAQNLVNFVGKHRIPLILKGSFRKANRTRRESFKGIGDSEAIEILYKVGQEFNIQTLTDVHTIEDIALVKDKVNIIQVPAFLSRQTDLIEAAARTEKWINIKKGQFTSPEDMKYAAEKVIFAGGKILLTERGTTFGYNDLVVDMRNIPIMKRYAPVIVDITHSTGEKPWSYEKIGLSAIAAGADGIFLETHPDPFKAPSDSQRMIPLDKIDELLYKLKTIKEVMTW